MNSDILEFLDKKINSTSNSDIDLTPIKYKNNQYYKIIKEILLGIQNTSDPKSDLQEMLDAQIVLNKEFIHDFYGRDWQTMFDKTITAMIHELCEAQRETNFKYWTFNPQKPNFNNLKEELVDVLHFFLTILSMTFEDAEEIKKEYFKKNLTNRSRINQGYIEDERNKP